MNNEIWLAGGTRTPIGGFLGTLAEVPAPVLGSVAIKESLSARACPRTRLTR